MELLTFIAFCILVLPYQVALWMSLFYIKNKIDTYANTVPANNIADRVLTVIDQLIAHCAKAVPPPAAQPPVVPVTLRRK
jgi:hypothetical protein